MQKKKKSHLEILESGFIWNKKYWFNTAFVM